VDHQVAKYTLHNATANSCLPAVIRLIEVGCSINEKDENHVAPLYLAALEGHELVVEEIVKYGAQVNAQGRYYGNALQAASFKGTRQS